MLAILRRIRAIIFPRVCLSCQKIVPESGPLFCMECLGTLTPLAETLCSLCGARRNGEIPCHAGALPLFCAFRYDSEPIRKAIYALKYDSVVAAAETLGILSAKLFLSSPFSAQCRKNGLPLFCVPIPLFPSRERERGYNQSALIAESFARHISLFGLRASCQNDFLIRVKRTVSQTEFHSRGERQKNISGAFLARKFSLPSGAIVLLIDDVSTSGATIEEAFRALRKAKVPHIAGLVIAKA